MYRKLKINPDFQNLIAPLSDEEFKQLEENILAHGRCRDAIKVWRNFIIDGHNRYAICQKHGLPYEVTETRFASRKDATLWILENQLGRRNLTDTIRIELATRKVELKSQKASLHTRKTIAAEASVCEQTVQKYMTIKETADPKLLAQVNNGDLKIGTAYKMLNVKTVKKLTTPEEMAELNSRYKDTAIINAINSIGRMYDFISGNVPIEGGDGATDMVCTRLKAQAGLFL